MSRHRLHQPVFRCFGILMVALILNGCMGSSGSSSAQAEATAACGDAEVRNRVIGENQRRNMALSLCFDPAAASVDAGPFVNSIGFNGDRLTFAAREVDRPRKTRLLILDPEGQVQLKVNVVIRNTSGESIEALASHIINEQQAILNLREDRRIHDYMLEVAYLQERITWSEKQALMAEWKPASQSSYTRLRNRLQDTARVLNAYRNGKAGEAELTKTANSAVQMLPAHGEYGARRLTEVAQAQSSPVPDVSHGTLIYRSRIQAVTRRIGNPNYGKFDSGGWAFSANFQFLTPVLDRETRL